jgi:hypothetical protein
MITVDKKGDAFSKKIMQINIFPVDVALSICTSFYAIIFFTDLNLFASSHPSLSIPVANVFFTSTHMTSFCPVGVNALGDKKASTSFSSLNTYRWYERPSSTGKAVAYDPPRALSWCVLMRCTAVVEVLWMLLDGSSDTRGYSVIVSQKLWMSDIMMYWHDKKKKEI